MELNTGNNCTPKPLMAFQARSSGHGSHWGFPLTSPNWELYPKYLQDLAQNDTTLLPFVGVNKNLPSSACPMAGGDAGYGMWDMGCPRLGPLRGFCPTEVFGEGSELQVGAKVGSSPVGWQLALAMEQCCRAAPQRHSQSCSLSAQRAVCTQLLTTASLEEFPIPESSFIFPFFPFFFCCRTALTLISHKS